MIRPLIFELVEKIGDGVTGPTGDYLINLYFIGKVEIENLGKYQRFAPECDVKNL